MSALPCSDHNTVYSTFAAPIIDISFVRRTSLRWSWSWIDDVKHRKLEAFETCGKNNRMHPDRHRQTTRCKKLAGFRQDTPYMWTAFIFRMCIYSTRIYRAQAIPACSMHMHAPQNKASSLGGALQRLHSLLSGTSCWRPESADFGLRPTRLPLFARFSPLRTNSYSNTLWLCSWFGISRQGKGNCLGSLPFAMFERSLWQTVELRIVP